MKKIFLMIYILVVTVSLAAFLGPGSWYTGGQHPRFPFSCYLFAFGSGDDVYAAERDALRRLVAIFGQGIWANQRMVDSYLGITANGAIVTSRHEQSILIDIISHTGMDNLIGVRLAAFRESDRGRSYVLAVINRADGIRVYRDRIKRNKETIASLTNIPPRGRNAFEGVFRYERAAVIADMNVIYGTVLSVLGEPAQGLVNGDNFRREAQAIRRAIPIGINVTNDRNGIIHRAFVNTFADFGFRMGATNPQYLLDINVEIQSSEFNNPLLNSGRTLIRTHVEIQANFIDTVTGEYLFAYDFSEHDVDRTIARAERLALNSAAQRIGRDFGNVLSEYLTSLGFSLTKGNEEIIRQIVNMGSQ
ncbi:MAG: LPP20 family lipoprotein [Treponema sp.]|nr:LPP20 family lipoprotein [Treponema sp.]